VSRPTRSPDYSDEGGARKNGRACIQQAWCAQSQRCGRPCSRTRIDLRTASFSSRIDGTDAASKRQTCGSPPTELGISLCPNMFRIESAPPTVPRDGGSAQAERNWCWNARPIYLLLYLDRRRLKERIHGRPRSDRKKRFLLSAVAPSTSSRHPRKARPINWAQRGGLASGGKLSLLTPRPHFTAPSWTLGHQVIGASDGAPFCRERRPTRVRRTPAAGSGLLAEASTLRAG
jgi:hypothetical protein